MTSKEKIKKLQFYIEKCKNLTETQRMDKHKVSFFKKEIERSENKIRDLV